MTRTMFSMAILTLVSLSAAAGCTSTAEEPTESSSDALAAAVLPGAPNNGCASVSIPACAQSTLGGACVGAGGGPGTCGSFQTPAQWIPAGPGVAVAGYDCNVCVPLRRPANAAAAADDEATPP